MDFTDPITLVLLAGVSLTAAAVTVLLANTLLSRAPWPSHLMFQGLDLPRRYSFRDGYLLSDPEPDDVFLTDPDDRVGAWEELGRALGALHPEVVERMTALRTRQEGFVLLGHLGEDSMTITGRAQGGNTVITVSPHDKRRAKLSIDRDGLEALEAEAALLRKAMDFSSDVIWQEDAEGRIVWANAAYFDLLGRIEGADNLVWPIHAVFKDHTTPPPDEGRLRRCPVTVEQGKDPVWYELSVLEMSDGLLFRASPIDRLVGAENSLRDFVQTLSRTFAHLPVGLAIFDKHRQLVLFNPALVTLSSLPTDWLSSRPDLFSFLDQLREHQRMPEPKDYQAWRASLAELEQAARDGTYQELWTLPTGQTYRVIGRPHADGAVAFMFEDITSEVALTRKFRGELDLYQAVMDQSNNAQAVFGEDGKLILSNSALSTLWPDAAPAAGEHPSAADLTGRWQAYCKPSPAWGELRDYIGGYCDRSVWEEVLQDLDGRDITCRISPLRGGASLVEFSQGGTGLAPLSSATEAYDEPQALAEKLSTG